MAALSSRRIIGSFAASDIAPTPVIRGRLLEELIAYLFRRCVGVRHYNNNALNAAGSSEVDVCFWNDRLRGSLDFLPQIIVVECKNTGEAVGSAAVRVFRDKLYEMHLDHGILIAANGITGNAQSLRAAHDVVRIAFAQAQTRIIVLTRAEIEALRNTQQLARLLQDKVLLLTMQAQTFQA